jgi:FKBP-type peptidyl-prolyl cis-trans isomerase FklB
MTRLAALALLVAAAAWGPARAASAAEVADRPGESVSLPGLRYQVLSAGPADGAHPTRADSVAMRYVGRLEDGQVFSTSPGDGKQVATFGVKEVIPGMSAALQLMRVGDRWRITMAPYLAYGPGRAFTPPPSGAGGVQAVQKRAIPPDATLVFDVELVAIIAPKTP